MARALGVVPEPERSQLLKATSAHEKAVRELDRKRRQVDAVLRAAVRAASAAGGSVREIAVLTGKSTNTIQRWLKEQ
ncbi:hypothetical protein BOOMER_43 [Mycobacterium phage Boomer]|uniref:Helix-turn-helix DNA binding domain protein n=1 Tax=Mycobacterium phage Boomer TaxID=2902893 RepID=B5A6Q0_9CAUD|nr:HTH DNA binding protein [Mycobacterium phage Boomer]ACF34105.1 hypothetical protein BOOMER_43 [Mycobacterium phage Boomer]